jgi:hypothetical protein
MLEKNALRNDRSKRKQPPATQLPTRQSAPPTTGEPVRGKGRPPGKRSDPNYQPTTVLLRQHTKKMANRLLEDRNTGQDLSELIEHLLLVWIQECSQDHRAGDGIDTLATRSLYKEPTRKKR